MASQPGRRVKPEGGSDRLPPALLRAGLYTALAAAFCFTLRGGNLAILFFRTQDLAILVASAALLLLLAWRRPSLPLPQVRIRPGFAIAAAALFALLVAWAGTWLVFGGYAMTRDEICADFDAAFLAHGLLIAPVPAAWQPYAQALMPQFMLPLPASAGWLSAYLPGNAMLRAIGGHLANPALGAIALLALHRVARRLWPERPLLALLPMLLLASSAQFLTMAMTAYAMPAHLAFNLIWLACFLRDDRRGDAGAIAAGFFATGLHQLLFHPLFALPFIAELWLAGRRRRFLLFVGAYALIGLFWASYWQLLLAAAGAAGAQGPGGLSFLLARLLTQLGTIDVSAFALMALNLARFLAWQNILLLPLALLAWPAIRRAEGIARPLASGVLLTIAAMLVLIPWQGHGWGYRYLHGFLGSCCLLAAYGWKSLDGGTEGRRRFGALALGTAASLAVLLPWHLVQAHDFVAPYRAAYAAIVRTPADIVLVDGTGLRYADDLVRNAPDLANRPLVMDLPSLSAGQAAYLCRRFRVAHFGAAEGRAFGIEPMDMPAATSAPPGPLSCGPPVRAP